MERGVEPLQLPVRQGLEEAFEEDNGFAKAGIEVVMGDVEEVPFRSGWTEEGSFSSPAALAKDSLRFSTSSRRVEIL